MSNLLITGKLKKEGAIFALFGILTLLSACQHQPSNKVGKAYDADSFRCTWDETHVLKEVRRQQLEQTGQQDDVFQQQLDQQQAQFNKQKDCEPESSFKLRQNKEINL